MLTIEQAVLCRLNRAMPGHLLGFEVGSIDAEALLMSPTQWGTGVQVDSGRHSFVPLILSYVVHLENLNLIGYKHCG